MDIQFLMRQAKKIEKAVEQAKEKLAELEVEAEAGGGLVQVKMNGRFEVRRITIDPKAIDPADRGLLEDLVAAAVNAAMEKARLLSEETMEKATGGLRIPGLGP
jgi:DNA-binding YbaB/EbfC family protein